MFNIRVLLLNQGGDNIKKCRNEWKYVLNNGQLSLLKSRLSEVLKIDSHTKENGRYLVHSLYFDDYNNISFKKVDSGISKRYKWRIRYYDEDLSYLLLERKEKVESRCHKDFCKISLEEYKKIINNDILDLVYDTDKKLLKEFIIDILNHNYKPVLIVDYERIAYIEDITNIRVTFDMNISVSNEFKKFLKGDYIKYYIQDDNYNVLEVKFDYILPSYIRNIIESYNFNQCSFSKYYLGRELLGVGGIYGNI